MNNYITIPNFLTKEECKDLLDFSLNFKLKEATIGDNKLNEEHRKSKINFYDYSDKFPFLKLKLIEIFKKEVNIKGFDINFSKNEFQFTKYETGGFYEWHKDNTSTSLSDRFCSIVIQLNDEYVGGDLQIKELDDMEITLEKGVGNLYLFYSHMIHRVTPIKSGIRYSLVNWFTLTPQMNYKTTLI